MTRLNSTVESRRRCVSNSQLVHDGFSREIENWTCWKFIHASQVDCKLETGSRQPTAEYTPPDTTQVNSTCLVFSFSTKSAGSGRELVANSIYTARRYDATQPSRRVASAVCRPIELKTHSFRVQSCTSGCPSGICWGSYRTTASASAADCRGSYRPETVGWGGWGRWWCETSRSWGCEWTRPVSTYGQTGDDEALRCGRGSSRARRTPVSRPARSDAGTTS